MGGAVFSPCSLAWGQTMVGGPPSKGLRPGPLYSVPLTPRKATVYSCLHWTLLDTHRQVCWARLAGLLLQFWVCLPGGSVVGLTRLASQVCCCQSPCPCGRPLLTHTSTGDTQTLKGGSGSVSWGPWVLACTKLCLSPLSISGNHGVWF